MGRPSGYRWGLLLFGAGCAEATPCERIGELCTAKSWERDIVTVVEDAVAVDMDGDGEREMVVLTRGAHQIALGFRDGWQSVMFVPEQPIALATVDDEVAVALAETPGVAIFGVDASRRLERRRELKLDHDAADLWSGDLDGDGSTELVVAQPLGKRLTLLEPETGARKDISVGEFPVALEVADLDGDAVLDIVVADPGQSAVHVLRGAGGGSFHPARKFLAIEHLGSPALADHDGDGDVDVLARNLRRAGVVVLHNNGEGELALPLELEFPQGQVQGAGLAVGPVTANGAAGITVPQGARLATWLREGTGWFGHVEEYLFGPATWVGRAGAGLLVGGLGYVTSFEYREGTAPFEVWRDAEIVGGVGQAALAVGDLDGDGLLDVAAATAGGVTVLRGTAGGFEAVASVPMLQTPRTLLIAEVNGDFRPDIVYSDGAVVGAVLAGADGSFAAQEVHAPAVPPLALAPLRRGPGVGEFVAVVPNDFFNAYAEQPNVGAALLRFGDGGTVAEETPLAEGVVVRALLGVDADGDGVDEPVMYVRRAGAPVFTRMVPVDGGFSPGPEYDLSGVLEETQSGGEYVRLAAGDPDADGELEVWVSRGGSSPLRISGLTTDPPAIAVADDALRATHFRDVDGDGHLDAVSVGSYFDELSYQRGRGDGTFEAEIHEYDFPGDDIVALALDPEAQFDVVSMSSAGLAAHRLRNVARPVRAEGEGYFYFHGWVGELTVGDLDGDGCDDVVSSADGWGGGVQVLWGEPTGALARADGLAALLTTSALGLGDVDGDGVIEVLTASGYWVDAHRFRPRLEDARLLLPELEADAVDLAIGDVDQDGHRDLLVLTRTYSQEGPDVRLSVSHGAGGDDDFLEFGEWTELVAVPGIPYAALAVGDVDGDGSTDVLVRPGFGYPVSPVLMVAEKSRAWAEPVEVPGKTAQFMRRGGEGRVDLLAHDGDTIVRHPGGEVGRREVLLRHSALAEGFLRRIGDIDGDGRADLLVALPRGTDVWLAGDDGYQRATTIVDMANVEIADVDCDGRADLVGVGNNGTVAVRLARAKD